MAHAPGPVPWAPMPVRITPHRPAVHPPQRLGVRGRCQHAAAVLQRPLHQLARGGQQVRPGQARERAGAGRREEQLRQGGCVDQALQHAVHEAGVAQVLQARPLRTWGWTGEGGRAPLVSCGGAGPLCPGLLRPTLRAPPRRRTALSTVVHLVASSAGAAAGFLASSPLKGRMEESA